MAGVAVYLNKHKRIYAISIGTQRNNFNFGLSIGEKVDNHYPVFLHESPDASLIAITHSPEEAGCVSLASLQS